MIKKLINAIANFFKMPEIPAHMLDTAEKFPPVSVDTIFVLLAAKYRIEHTLEKYVCCAVEDAAEELDLEIEAERIKKYIEECLSGSQNYYWTVQDYLEGEHGIEATDEEMRIYRAAWIQHMVDNVYAPLIGDSDKQELSI